MTPQPIPDTAEIAARFLRILTVERVEEDYFRGIATPGGRGRVFGGQIIAQALMAAGRTAPADRLPHSLHAYFMRAGAADEPVLYRVARDRDGGSFTTRRVVAIQKGEPILNLAASFHIAEPGLSHQADMPDVPPPEALRNEAQLAEAHPDLVPERMRYFLTANRPIEIRPCVMRPPFDKTPKAPRFAAWMRCKGPIPDDPLTHRVALSFASDMGLLSVSMLPHGKGFSDADMRCASLDHSVWLHETPDLNDWHLYATDSPWSGGARGFTRGRVFTRDGRLIADTAQEGLIRHVGD